MPALAAIHNFRRLNGDVGEDDWDPESDDWLNIADPFEFLFPSPEPFQEYCGPAGLTTADLSVGITEAETAQADARRDDIAARMWASYQVYLAQLST